MPSGWLVKFFGLILYIWILTIRHTDYRTINIYIYIYIWSYIQIHRICIISVKKQFLQNIFCPTTCFFPTEKKPGIPTRRRPTWCFSPSSAPTLGGAWASWRSSSASTWPWRAPSARWSRLGADVSGKKVGKIRWKNRWENHGYVVGEVGFIG